MHKALDLQLDAWEKGIELGFDFPCLLFGCEIRVILWRPTRMEAGHQLIETNEDLEALLNILEKELR